MSINKQSAEENNAKNESKNNNWRFGVVGNIVKQHLDIEGVVRYGTKVFTGGTKVYIDGKGWNNETDTVSVIGRNRFGRYVIESVPVSLIEDVRVQRIYKPTVIQIMCYVEAVEGWTWWKKTSEDKKEAKAFVDSWKSSTRTN